MSNKPIFVATHPRACSTAFERVFMTRRDILKCVHEPFGDAFYFGPERLSARYEHDEEARKASGFGDSTFKTIVDRIERENSEGKRVFIKDITHYLVPPEGKPASIAPSLVNYKRGVGTSQPARSNGASTQNAPHGGLDGASDTSASAVQPVVAAEADASVPYPTFTEPGNPTVMPSELLKQFHFTFLIRHPRNSIPSYFRCTVPPLDSVTGFYNFMPSEAGYDELRRVFDYLREIGHVGPGVTGEAPSGSSSPARDGIPNGGAVKDVSVTNGANHAPPVGIDICVIDADDLLDNPEGIIRKFCENVGIEYSPSMLTWDTEEEHKIAKDAFEKWKGFHEDAIESKDLKPRAHKEYRKSDKELYAEWVGKFGEDGARVVKETVEANIPHYEYLKSFAIKLDYL